MTTARTAVLIASGVVACGQPIDPASFATDIDDAHHTVAWSYDGELGPDAWARLHPDFAVCSKGIFQSPVDLPTKVTPGEHRVRLDYADAGFPLEMHLVHRSEEGHFLVVGALFEEGDANPLLAVFVDDVPMSLGEAHHGTRLSVADALPDAPRFYTYRGSFTTPPCTEGVRWLVLMEPLSASPAQIRVFRRAAGGNNRPVVPLGDRVVERI